MIASGTQGAAILDELRANVGKWVAMPRLWEVSGAFAVHSRISNLRAEGYQIENFLQRVGRKKNSFYKLTDTQLGFRL